MASKDIALDLVERLDLLKQNGTDYLLITLQPGKNADCSDIWYELHHPDSPLNLLQVCFSLFVNIYDKNDLIPLLVEFCRQLDSLDNQGLKQREVKRNKRKRLPPNDNTE